jgi:hypothetical protein
MFGSGQCLMFETWGLKRVVSNLEAVSRSQPCNPVYDEREEEITIKNAKERKGKVAMRGKATSYVPP